MSKNQKPVFIRAKPKKDPVVIECYNLRNVPQPDGAIWIPVNVPSSKNGKEIVMVHNKRFDLGLSNRKIVPKTVNNALVNTYIYQTKNLYFDLRSRFHELISGKEPPYHIEFTFVRDRDNDWDYTNIAQIVQDLMVKNSWIPDDNYHYLKPFFGDPILDREKPGVIIRVL